MRLQDLKTGDTVYWDKDRSGTVQSIHGRFVNIRNGDRTITKNVSVLRKKP